MLQLDNVCKRYADHIVLDSVDLHVQKSTIVGLAGLSGSGKSTLLRCIQQLTAIDAGTIRCEGKTGFMFQDFQLFPHMTAIDNVMYAKRLHAPNADHYAEAMSLLTKLGVANKATHYPSQLSGGQRQRVALARSLILHPDLLLCDEPTSGLDVATITDIVTLLTSVRDMGITMIIASHDLDFLARIADNVVVLTSGKIATQIEPKTVADPIALLKKYYQN